MPKRLPEIRGLLIHVTHYDPHWCMRKGRETKFDLGVALEVVEAMAAARLNLLVVDCADGVAYASHPELKRHYTVPMGDVRALADAARERGIDVVPKLNFSKSGRNLHDMWLRPHWDPISWLDGFDDYWRVAADCIAELVAACRPQRFFHVGMDEDHYRSLAQYVEAIEILRGITRRHRLRTVIWNDSCYFGRDVVAEVHADKSRAAEDLLPRDVVHVLWDYERAHPAIVRRIAAKGFDVWAAPGAHARLVRAWRRAILAGGGSGLLMTHWIKCDRANRGRLLTTVRALGAEYGKEKS
jgi:hypothetical protein